jgi:hypothetical protein
VRQLSSYYLNPLALCVYTGLVLAGVFLDYRSHHINQLPLVFVLGALVATLAWAFNFKRLLGMSEIPVATIASAAQGYVELFGTSKSLTLTRSPIRGVECVWFRLWIYARDTNYMWRLADYRISEQLFELQDDSGVCRIDPRGAEVFAASRHVVVQHDHKYIEDVLFADKPVYVLGDLDTGSQINTEAEIHQDAGKLITQLKQSKARLLQQFDLNRDGEIDMHEWELARESAYAEVRAKHAQRLQSELHLIAKPANKRLFLISGISPHALRQHYQRWAWAHFSFFCLAILFSVFIDNLAV